MVGGFATELKFNPVAILNALDKAVAENPSAFYRASESCVTSTDEPDGSVYSFCSAATDGSDHIGRFEDDGPPLSVLNRYHDVLEELVRVMRARQMVEWRKKAKAAKEMTLARKLTLFGKGAPTPRMPTQMPEMDAFLPIEYRVGFEFGQGIPSINNKM